MPAKPKPGDSPAALRRLAGKSTGRPPADIADADVRKLLHELEVHQIELEMQNVELRAARDEAEGLLVRYTELYDFAPVGYFTLAADCRIRLANLTGSTMLGCGRSQLIGRSFAMRVAKCQRDGFRKFLKQVFQEKGGHAAEFELNDATQPVRFVNIEARRSPGGLECSAIMVDVTARTLALERTRVSEIRYRRLFEAAHDGVLLIDPVTRAITDANPFMTRLLGYPHAELIGKELLEIGLLRDAAASKEMFHKLKHSHEVRYEDLPLESRTGRRQEVEVVANLYQEDGKPVIQCNIRDITARKLAEGVLLRNVKLKQEIVRRKAVEEDLRKNRREQGRLLRQSRMQEKQLRDLSHRILHAQEEERRRISRELHDVIAQTLVGISFHLAALAQSGGAIPKSLQQRLVSTCALVESAMATVHEFARELRPTMLDDLGLVPALQAHLKQFTYKTGIPVRLDAGANIERTTHAVRTALYRIAQEALTNACRHAKPTHVSIGIQADGQTIRMRIHDDGIGFPVSNQGRARKTKGLGLISMRERAEMVGGVMQIQSPPGGPTILQVIIPATAK